MASVTGLTSVRMLAIEAASVVSGLVNSASRLILTKRDGTTIDAGYVRGARWGTTTVWIYGTVANALVSFSDGLPPQVGDLVVSNNGLGPGGVGKITAVVDPTHANLEDASLSLQGPTGPTGPTGPPGPAITGFISMYGGATAPAGYLSCDGAAVSRTTYSALFAIIGTNYGVGDGTTTFLLPNLASKFPRGNAPGSTGGSDTHGHANTFAQTDHSHLGVDHLHSQAAHSHVVTSHLHGLSAGWAKVGMTGGTPGLWMSRRTGISYTPDVQATLTVVASSAVQGFGANLDGTTDSAPAVWTNGQTGPVGGPDGAVSTGAMDRGATTGGASTNAITGAVTNGSNIPAFTGVNFIIKT